MSSGQKDNKDVVQTASIVHVSLPPHECHGH